MEHTIHYMNWKFSGDSIIDSTSTEKESLSMTELTIDTAEFSVRCNDPAIRNFTQGTPVTQYVGGSLINLWYVRSIERKGPDLYKIYCMSSLGRLTQYKHYGGVYNGAMASTVIAEIVGDIPYYIESVFQNIAIYGWLPIASARDNLQQVLFALNANLRTDSEGVLRIENLSTTASTEISSISIYSNNAAVQYDSPITSVTLVEHSYTPGSESKTISYNDLTNGQYITFDEPMQITGWTGFTVTESGANYAVVTGSSSGTITGKPYVHATREITKNVSNKETSSADINTIRVDNATLVGPTASADVSNRLVEYYKHRNLVNIGAVADFVRAGDVVKVYHPYDKEIVNACVLSSEKIFSAIAKNTLSALVDFTPWQVVAFKDMHVIKTGSGTWKVPTGVTEVTVVLIGGGDGGYAGSAGSAGTANSFTWIDVGSRQNITCAAGSGGTGGSGGAAGGGGKILVKSLTVTPGQSFSYSCGSGGTAGRSGGATKFGSYSSANGGSSSNGYTDIDGTVYALPGISGTNGGNGGSGGAAGNIGGSGGNSGTHFGGSGGNAYIRNYQYSSIATDDYELKEGGGGGGGASGYANGNAGQSGGGVTFTSGGGSGYFRGGDGGNGASGGAGGTKTTYGEGGNGGNGGGGGGGTGAMSFRQRGDYYFGATDVSPYYTPSAGSGGSGGSGGTGGPGCIILIYRQPESS